MVGTGRHVPAPRLFLDTNVLVSAVLFGGVVTGDARIREAEVEDVQVITPAEALLVIEQQGD